MPKPPREPKPAAPTVAPSGDSTRAERAIRLAFADRVLRSLLTEEALAEKRDHQVRDVRARFKKLARDFPDAATGAIPPALTHDSTRSLRAAERSGNAQYSRDPFSLVPRVIAPAAAPVEWVADVEALFSAGVAAGAPLPTLGPVAWWVALFDPWVRAGKLRTADLAAILGDVEGIAGDAARRTKIKNARAEWRKVAKQTRAATKGKPAAGVRYLAARPPGSRPPGTG